MCVYSGGSGGRGAGMGRGGGAGGVVEPEEELGGKNETVFLLSVQ